MRAMFSSHGRRRSGVGARMLACFALQLPSTSMVSGAGIHGDMVSRPSSADSCVCQDPFRGEGSCYEPVCGPGYYKCCVTCRESTCYGKLDMELSYRGIRECIKCPAGFYCDGCDRFFRCPPNDIPGREGPRVARPGSAQLADCEACSAVQESTLAFDRCVDKFTDVCDRKRVSRCIRGCESPDPTRRKKLTACELMKCTMYCAKEFSDQCAARIADQCRFLTEMTEEEQMQWGLDIEYLNDCDVNCNGATLHRYSVLAVFLMLVAALLQL
eukprot:gnl/TRDRNA2_/TRDRNA2_181423_c0_seq1.p1 gnl/TRDRNA2_/TRDRNA2_181423_c0~~gnl/TRDRNA2_/TRDRNA2_181423_c0_seq1.p1  ORF type:complete len:271 (-),score=35.06 gnl/TRDRNA2_/TRDRNA2_181423_c0_seq1:141-953(-)